MLKKQVWGSLDSFFGFCTACVDTRATIIANFAVCRRACIRIASIIHEFAGKRAHAIPYLLLPCGRGGAYAVGFGNRVWNMQL